MVRRRQLMTELRRLRDEAGLTQDEVAGQLDWHPTKVMRIETGRTAPHPNDVRVMLTLFGVTSPEQVSALVKLAQDARQRGWWYSYRDVLLNRYEFFIGLETEASSIRNFELAMIPGLLQTEENYRPRPDQRRPDGTGRHRSRPPRRSAHDPPTGPRP